MTQAVTWTMQGTNRRARVDRSAMLVRPFGLLWRVEFQGAVVDVESEAEAFAVARELALEALAASAARVERERALWLAAGV